MRPLRSGVVAVLVALGLAAGSAQAFGPMMLLMLPMMMGGQHAMETGGGAGDGKETHASRAPQEEQRHTAIVDEKRMPSIVRSESSQIGIEAESGPAPREDTK